MIVNNQPRIWVNRVVGFLAGGLIALAVSGFAWVTPVRSENKALTAQLDEIQNGAALLLREARAMVENQSYGKAAIALNTLFEKQPGSNEAIEGKLLYSEIEATVLALDREWAESSEAVRTAWNEMMAAELRAEFEKDRAIMEATMIDTLEREWQKSKLRVRQEWESREM